MELGGQKGELFCTYRLCQYRSQKEDIYLASLAGSDMTTQEEERLFFPCLATAQPMKNCYILNSQFPPMGFLFITTSPNIPFFSLLLYLKFTWFTITACPELQFFAAPK